MSATENGPAPKSPIAVAVTIAALTVGWLISSAGLLMITVWIGAVAWANVHSGRTGGVYELIGLAFFISAPLGIASVARANGLRRTAVAFVVLTGLVFAGAVTQMTVSPL